MIRIMVFSNDQNHGILQWPKQCESGEFFSFSTRKCESQVVWKEGTPKSIGSWSFIKITMAGVAPFSDTQMYQIRSKIIVLIGFNPIRITIFIYISIKLLIFPWKSPSNCCFLTPFSPSTHRSPRWNCNDPRNDPVSKDKPKEKFNAAPMRSLQEGWEDHQNPMVIPWKTAWWRTGFPVLEI